MKRINFLVTDFLNQQIEEAMLRLGIMSKSEFFRMLVLNCIKDNVPSKNNIDRRQVPVEPVKELTKNEKIILSYLQRNPMTINDLVDHTGFSVSELSVILMQLNLKKRVLETGTCWSMI